MPCTTVQKQNSDRGGQVARGRGGTASGVFGMPRLESQQLEAAIACGEFHQLAAAAGMRSPIPVWEKRSRFCSFGSSRGSYSSNNPKPLAAAIARGFLLGALASGVSTTRKLGTIARVDWVQMMR
jgi:hypothetical protein